MIKSNLIKLMSIGGVMLFANTAWSAQTEITPEIALGYTSVLDNEGEEQSESGASALELTPGIKFSRKGSVWESTLDIVHNELFVDSEEYDGTSYTNYSINNLFNFYQGRVLFEVGADRSNRNVDNTFESASDPIFRRFEYIDVDTLNSNLVFQTVSNKSWRSSLSLSATDTYFDETTIENTSSNVTSLLKGTSYTSQFEVAYAPKSTNANLSLSGSYSESDRSVRGKQVNQTINFYSGIPISENFEVALSGAYNKPKFESSTITRAALETSFWGIGLGWRFGKKSKIILTKNFEERGSEQYEQETEQDFVGLKLELYPSKTTFLVYDFSRRFYGESHSLSLNLTGNRWGFSASYGEELTSQTRLQRSNVSLGTFLCPDGFSDSEDCQLLNEIPTDIPVDSDLVEFFDPTFEIDEEISLVKRGSATLRKEFRKTDISLSYTVSEADYIESDLVRNSESLAFDVNYKSTRRNSFSLSYVDTHSKGRSQERDSERLSLKFTRKLTRKATGFISLMKVRNNSLSGFDNRKDTRLELNYSYKF